MSTWSKEKRLVVIAERFQSSLGLNAIIDEIADDQDTGAATRKLKGSFGQGLWVVGDGVEGWFDGLSVVRRGSGDELRLFAVGRDVGQEGIVQLGGLLGRRWTLSFGGGIGQAVCGADGCGHEEGMASGVEMVVDDLVEEMMHILVGGVDLVDDEEVAMEGCGAKMGVLDLKGGHQHLVHRTYGDRGGEEALGTLGSPGPFMDIGSIVGPLDFVARQGVGIAVELVDANIAGNGKGCGGTVGTEERAKRSLDAILELFGSASSGHGEVHAIDFAGEVKADKASEGGFGLAGARIGFQNGEIPTVVDGKVHAGLLNLVGFKAGDLLESKIVIVSAISGRFGVEVHGLEQFIGPITGETHAVFIAIIEGDEASV